MNTTPSARGVAAGVRRRVTQILVTLLLQAVLLYVAAGRPAWPWGWVYLGTYLVIIGINGAFMRRRPEQMAERGQAGFQQAWDRWIGLAWALLYFFILPLVAGLDQRYRWSPDLSLGLHLAGLAAFAAGLALFSWAMIANAYFSTVVRLQSERGHTVCDRGPYRAVRHPGYLGAVLQQLGAPLLLGSPWALVPGIMAAVLMVLRTTLEDRMLRAELPGYPEYAGRVRYRLLPGVW
jgi:protein-S-isoprenylcysteine O-methyltransferase Ste14